MARAQRRRDRVVLPSNSEAVDVVAEDRAMWIELGWPEPTAMAAFISLLRSQQDVVGRTRQALIGTGVSITEHAAMSYLSMSPGRAQPLARVSERLLISGARCSYLIDGLETKGWARREPHPTDGRATLAVLTRLGYTKLTQATKVMAAATFGFKGVDNETLEILVKVLTTIRLSVGDRLLVEE